MNERKIQNMAIKVTESAERITPAKKTVEVKDVLLREMKFVDETGDITAKVIEALPEIDKVTFKISVELPTDED